MTRIGLPNREKKEKTPMSSAERFKNAFSYKDVKVHFVGAWYVVFILAISACLRNFKLSGTLFLQLG